MSRSSHGMPTHGRPCDTTEPDTISTDTPTTSSPPTWPPEPESDRADAAPPDHGPMTVRPAHDAPMRTEPPRVTYGPDYEPHTEWENLVLLEAVRATQRQIGTHVRGVAVEAGHELVVVHACIDNEDADTAEDLAELASEIEVSMEQ